MSNSFDFHRKRVVPAADRDLTRAWGGIAIVTPHFAVKAKTWLKSDCQAADAPV